MKLLIPRFSSAGRRDLIIIIFQVFILHLQLKAFIFKGDLPEKPTLNSTTGPTADSGRSHTSDISSASFGSDVSLGTLSFHQN